MANEADLDPNVVLRGWRLVPQPMWLCEVVGSFIKQGSNCNGPDDRKSAAGSRRLMSCCAEHKLRQRGHLCARDALHALLQLLPQRAQRVGLLRHVRPQGLRVVAARRILRPLPLRTPTRCVLHALGTSVREWAP